MEVTVCYCYPAFPTTNAAMALSVEDWEDEPTAETPAPKGPKVTPKTVAIAVTSFPKTPGTTTQGSNSKQLPAAGGSGSAGGLPPSSSPKGGGVNGAAIMGMSKALKAFKKPGKAKKEEEKHSAKKDAFLIDAATQGSLNLVVKFISESGCSPDLLSAEGKCLIQLALEGGHEAVVMYLFLECHARVVYAAGLGLKGVQGFDCLHISLIRQCVVKTSDREKGFQVACEALAHSSNPTLSSLLLAEMYGEVAKIQPTHKNTLNGNKDILEKMAFQLLDDAKEIDVMQILGGCDPSFGNVSPLQVAIRAHNSLFVSHPLVQDFVAHVWKGEDPLQQRFASGGVEGEGSGSSKRAELVWDFVERPKLWFGSPRGHFFLHIYTYLMFIYFHANVSANLGGILGVEGEDTTPGTMEHLFAVLTLCGLINELEKLYRQGWDNYLTFFWNYADVLLFAMLLVFMVIRNTSVGGEYPVAVRTILGFSAIPMVSVRGGGGGVGVGGGRSARHLKNKSGCW